MVIRAAITLSAVVQAVQVVGGENQTLRITPYRTEDHTVRGAVLELVAAAP